MRDATSQGQQGALGQQDRLRAALIQVATERDELRRRLEGVTSRQTEPIAIVSMACRLPGGVSDPEQYWAMLAQGRDGIEPFPADRWDAAALYDPDPAALGKTYCVECGFLRDADKFDPGFFGISPREAAVMDPQQRVLLETTWQLLERAGIAPRQLHGSATGIFIGQMGSDYACSLMAQPDKLDGYVDTGNAGSVTSGRLAYVLGAQGPAVTVDTACSSSLVALHLGCQALRQGECDQALVGGVTVMATPYTFVEASRLGALSRSGRCKSFSAGADGTVFSEGCGMLLLKRLADAKRDGDKVHALILGTALNQDGKSQGLTAPNGPAQEKVIRQALKKSGLTPEDIDAIEAHGTGTVLGDPIEAGALAEVFGPGRKEQGPVYLGSAKSNLGHTQAAAGVAGVIKMVLALREQQLPPTLHAEKSSPHILWEGSGLELLAQGREWKRGQRPRRAGVSSFGISGTNAHVVLQEAPLDPPQLDKAQDVGDGVQPFLLSAMTPAALSTQAAQLATYLKEHPALSLAEVAYALATTRTHFLERAVLLASDREQLLTELELLAQGAASPQRIQGQAQVQGKLAFVFPGHGSQWAKMAQQLLDESAVFRASIERCALALVPHVPWSLLAVLREEAGSPALDRVDVGQPVLFCVMVALAELWRSLGVVPDAVIGHSHGEVAAACAAGALPLAEAARIVALRSQALRRIEGKGVTAAVELSAEELQPLLARYGDRLSVTAFNGPRFSAVGGDPEAVTELLAELTEKRVFAKRVRMSYASHCALVDVLEKEVLTALAGSTGQAAPVAMYSTVTAQPVAGPELGAGYWYKNLRQPVLLYQGLQRMLQDGFRYFVEVSAHPVLSLGLQQALEVAGESGAVVGTLRREQGGRAEVLRHLGGLHVHGYSVAWPQVLPAQQRIPLPTYPFERQRYWIPASGLDTRGLEQAGMLSVEHPFLGAEVTLAGSGAALFTARLSLADQPYLRDHRVLDTTLLPGTGLLELALCAGHTLGLGTVAELTLMAPVWLPAQGALQLQVRVEPPDGQGQRALAIYSRVVGEQKGLSFAQPEAGDQAAFIQHAAGVLSAAADRGELPRLTEWPPAGAEEISVTGLYDRLWERGYQYGPSFQGLRKVYRQGSTIFAQVELPESVPEGRRGGQYGVHPALLDAALHALFATESGDPAEQQTRLPFAWENVALQVPGQRVLRLRAEVQQKARAGARGGETESEQTVAMWLYDVNGNPVLQVGQFTERPVSREALREAEARGAEDLYRVQWTAQALQLADLDEGPLVIIGNGARAQRAAAALLQAGGDCSEHPSLAALLEAVRVGEPVPTRIVRVLEGEAEADRAQAAEHTTAALLHEVQSLLQAPELEQSALLVVTKSAVSVGDGDTMAGLHQAGIWGLLRTVRREHPERAWILLDSDDSERSDGLLPAAMCAKDGIEAALRQGERLLPRVVSAASQASAEPVTHAAPLRAGGTVLVTGGTGGMGAELARHLVQAHGVQALLLLSRQGADAPGVSALVKELQEKGCQVRVAACDVADAKQVAAQLQQIDPAQPLRAVFHCAAVLDDAMVITLDRARVGRAFSAKARGAWNLHQATRGCALSAFVVFSSCAGLLESAGQGNYAAANTFVDGLCALRRAQGLPGLALAWGDFGDVGMLSRLSAALQARARAQGFLPLRTPEAMALLDLAMLRSEALLMPVRLDLRTLQAQREPVAWLLRDKVRQGGEQPGQDHVKGLADQLSGLPVEQRERAVVELVRAEAAAVLRLPSAAALRIDQSLMELGLDSMIAVELRNRLSALIEKRLPATLLFDYPTVKALAPHLLSQISLNETKVLKAAPRQNIRKEGPIAIVGMACRTPGGAITPRQLWDLLRQGTDASSEFPRDRGWDVEGIYDPDPEAVGKTYTTRGGFLSQLDQFDAAFFGIAPREAERMDPQQRMLLEVSWEALERSGIAPMSLSESRTGVYLGVMGTSGYETALLMDLTEMDGYVGMGSSLSTTAGRISYLLGLQGPALTVDTACSSSLVSTHLAMQALRRGECDLALSGGATVMMSPGGYVEFCRLRGLAPDGRCKSFGDAADGTVWSEGCGMLVLERLEDAQRKGHPVLAVIRGSAVNQDGRSQGLSAPNGPAQERVIQEALKSASLTPQDIDVVEAHGTGTRLGDPIEAQALLATYGQGRQAERPLWLGSLKSNLGHTQAAAGVLGMMKVVLALQNEQLPKSLHADTPSRQIDWSSGHVALLQAGRPWQRSERPRRAGVSSFGVSGTNAHLILEEAPRAATAVPTEDLSTPALGGSFVPLLLSGQSEAAVRAQAAELAEALDAQPNLSIRDVAWTLAMHRSHLGWRAALAADARAGSAAVVASLRALAQGQVPALASAPTAAPAGSLAVLFSGQGSQLAQMGEALYAQLPVFRKALDALCACLDPQLPQPLLSVMFAAPGTKESALLDETLYTQPALFALEVALYRQWQAFGLRAEVVLGHSVGEIAAAHVAGILSEADACTLVAARARLMQEAPRNGAMYAVSAAEAEVRAALAGYESLVAVAAVNEPTQTVISGEEAATRAVAEVLAARKIKVKRLRVSHAFHSPQMDGMLQRFREVAQRLSYAAPQLTVVSTVQGADSSTMCSAEYWVRQVREAVRFAEAVDRAYAGGARRFLECGPQGVLCAMAAGTLNAKDGVRCGASQRAGQDPLQALTAAIGEQYAGGTELDLRAVLGNGQLADLPTYPFQKKRFWVEVRGNRDRVKDATGLGLQSLAHPLLGGMTSLPEGGYLFTSRLSTKEHAWAGEHQILDHVLWPGTGYVEQALAAGQRVGTPVIESLTMGRPIVLAPGGAVRLQIHVGPLDPQGRRPFTVHSLDAAEDDAAVWSQHAAGTLGPAEQLVPAERLRLDTWPPRGATAIDLSEAYQRLEARGYQYGPSFQGLREVYRHGNTFYAEAEIAEELEPAQYGVHPALLDCFLEAVGIDDTEDQRTMVPFEWERVQLHMPGAGRMRMCAEAQPRQGDSEQSASLWLYDLSGNLVLQVKRLSVREVSRDALGEVPSPVLRHLYRLQWSAQGPDQSVDKGSVKGGIALIVGADAAAGSDGHERRAAAALRRTGTQVERYQSLEQLLAAVRAGLRAPEVIVRLAGVTADADAARAAERSTAELLQEVQVLAQAPELEPSAYVLLTCGAVSTKEEEPVTALHHSGLWGVLRTVRSEYQDRTWLLVDSDDSEASAAALLAAVRAKDCPEVALRQGTRFLASFVQVVDATPESVSEVADWDGSGTVLVTGGTSGMGAELAKHLVDNHGIRNLVLMSRQGPAAAGVVELVSGLQEKGCTVQVVACDVGDMTQLTARLHAAEQVAQQPLRAVFHCAGLLDDGVATAQTPERIAKVFAPKARGAWNLHELTRERELIAFVVFSSAAGLLDSAGQLNYAAANTFVDGLCALRRAQGQPGHALAWGELGEVGMASKLSEAMRKRSRASGMVPLRTQEAMALLDLSLIRNDALLMPIHLDLHALRSAGEVPWLLRDIVRVSGTASRAADNKGAVERLAGLKGEQRQRVVLELVRTEVAAVLRLSDASVLNNNQPLNELGLDSLMAVELRNRLGKLFGTKLPATFVFDYPTPTAIGQFFSPPEAAADDAAEDVRNALLSLSVEKLQEAGLWEPLLRLAGVAQGSRPAPKEQDLSALSDAELRDLIDDL